MKKLIQLPKSPWDINPDTLIFSDLHLHEREEFSRVDPKTGLNTRLAEGLSILDQIIEIKETHPTIIMTLNLGDIFELKDRIPNHILTEYKNRVDLLGYYRTLVGNHDYNLPNYPVLGLFDGLEPQKNFIDFPQIHPDNNWGFIPFQRKHEDFVKALIKVNDENPKIIFFHQELPGGEYESGKKIPGFFPSQLFKPNIIYISGHLHKYQVVGKVVYIGGPYQKNFSDEGCKKFVWLLNSKTLEMAPLELNYPKFVSYHTNDLNEDLSNCKGNYVRMIGEVEARLWTPEQKKALREEFEKAGALGASFQVKTKRHHQTKIKEEEIDHDDLIIKSYSEENHGSLDPERLLKVGLEIFNQN